MYFHFPLSMRLRWPSLTTRPRGQRRGRRPVGTKILGPGDTDRLLLSVGGSRHQRGNLPGGIAFACVHRPIEDLQGEASGAWIDTLALTVRRAIARRRLRRVRATLCRTSGHRIYGLRSPATSIDGAILATSRRCGQSAARLRAVRADRLLQPIHQTTHKIAIGSKSRDGGSS